jgi:hypothetical protein
MDKFVDCPQCGAESYRDEFTAGGGRCPTCGHYHEELDMARHHSSRQRVADESGGGSSGKMHSAPPPASSGPSPTAPSPTNPSGGGQSLFGNGGDGYQAPAPTLFGNGGDGAPMSAHGVTQLNTPTGYDTSTQTLPGAQPSGSSSNLAPPPSPYVARPGDPSLPVTMLDYGPEGSLAPTQPIGPEGQQVRVEMPGQKTSARLRVAAIDFLADQNVTDRAELLFRARRHAELQVGQLTRPQADAVVRAFCAAVDAELAHTPPAPRARRVARTSAIVPDFADELLF